MTLFWSIFPFEQIMAGSEHTPLFEELRIGDVTVLVSSHGKDIRIERVVSANPSDYLNPQFQPGRVLHRSHLKA